MNRLKIFVALFLSLTPAFAGDLTPLLGKWEYRQANSGYKSGFDPEGEQLEIREINGKITGSYLGLERMGEEGLYYTATHVTTFKFEGGKLSFIVPGRSFYSVRPKSVADAERMKDVGATKMELKFTGEIENGKLVLHCSSNDNSCPDEKLTFEKGKW